MKPESHKKVTALALELYIEHENGTSPAKELKKYLYKNATLSGSADEDHGLSRISNWHFFPENQTIHDQKKEILNLVTIRPTSRWIIARRQEKLLREIKCGPTSGLFSTLGRLMHHIQDMNTPSHVRPVYHAFKTHDSYEDYLCKEDTWPLLVQELSQMRPRFNAILEMPYSGDFVGLYEAAAKRLLNNLEPNGKLFPIRLNPDTQAAVPSEAFWLPYDETEGPEKIPFNIQGFGTFGPLGKQFGSCRSYTINGTCLPVDPGVYLKVAVFFLGCAIEDTLKAFQCLARLYSPRS